MKRIPRAAYTVEFNAATVRQVLIDKKAAEVGRELGVVEQTSEAAQCNRPPFCNRLCQSPPVA